MKRVIAVIAMVFLLSPLFAIGFGYHVFEVRTELDFAHGIFPSSVVYQFNFPMPDLVQDSKTILAFRLDNGLEYRRLDQHPDDGSFLSEMYYTAPRDYMVLFDEFNLYFSQGFFAEEFSSEDLLSVFFSINGRFENAYERLSWLSDKNNTEGVFGYSDKDGWHNRFPDSSWKGAPELSSDRSMFHTALSLGFKVDYMREGITKRDGAKFTAWLHLAPDWMLLSDKSGNYLGVYAGLDLAKTILAAEQGNGRTWGTLYIEDSLRYRYLYGSKVPKYAQGGDIWGDADAPALSNAITNRLAFVITGPQIELDDIYPKATIFWDAGISFGHPLNSTDSRFRHESVGSYGIRVEFILFNIAELYYEIGCVYDPLFADSSYVEQSFGFRLGV